MKLVILSLVVCLAAAQHVPSWKLDEIAAQAAPAQPCCKACPVAGQVKYYSIDKVHNMCGECCMKPSQYKLYKIFEPGLTLAPDNTPCADSKFHTYDSTVTHGFGPIKMTLDLYKPDASASAALALKVFDAKALGCCGKKITGGTGAVSTCVVNLCTAGAYKPSYCSESADTLKGLATCAANVASCSLKACALHCLGGACSAGCTACVKGACDAGPTGIFACMAPLGYTPPPNCDGSLKSC